MTQSCAYPENVADFHDAVKRCDTEMIEGVDVKLLNQSDEHGFTALMWAAWLGHVKVGELLLELGVDKEAQDVDGQNALFHSCWQGEGRFASFLVNNNVNLNAIDIDGETALMAAAHQGHKSIVSTLLDHKADATIIDRNNMTAVDHALKWGNHKDIADLIKAVLPEGSHVKEMTKKFELRPEAPVVLQRYVRQCDEDDTPSSPSYRSSTPGVSLEEPTEVASTQNSNDPKVTPNWEEVEIESESEPSIRRHSIETERDDDIPEASKESCEPEDIDIGRTPGIQIWKRRQTVRLEVDVRCEPSPEYERYMSPPPVDTEESFNEDVKRFVNSFPPVATGCTVCEGSSEDTKFMYCADCDETLCETCWKNEHQNKKRREHVPKPAVRQEARFEAVAQVAVQLSRVLEKTERQRDGIINEISKHQEVQTALVENLHAERLRRSQLEEEVHRVNQKLKDTNNILHTRDQKYQNYIKDLQAKQASEKHSFQVREAEIRRHVNISTNELSEARRLFALREAEYKLQTQTANMRAQRASANLEQCRVDMTRMRSENERVREDTARMRHRLDLERMKAQRMEEENKRLLKQIQRMMPEYEQKRSRSEYTFPNAGTGAGYFRSGTGSGVPPQYSRYGGSGSASGGAGTGPTPPPSSLFRSGLKEEVKEALAMVKKYGIENVDDKAINSLSSNLSSITVFEAWVIIDLPMGSSGARDRAKKLLTKLHPDRAATKSDSLKDTLRKRFQIVNHLRPLLPDK
eukprot:TRINITY_DN7414_c0_g5_i1.p1 TRINITY_DN7414_c0_g5~~TRINITY_DN7414_c0_g5_i1.p1  ORF type:complete len:765 (+),score=245.29 TRINITY_DN7414_c0_g5_i1:49-2295(+)